MKKTLLSLLAASTALIAVCCKPEPKTIEQLLLDGDSFTVSLESACVCPPDSEDPSLRVAQGAASDGSHFYLVLRDRTDSKARIYKYDMQGNLLLKSAIFCGNHCNDMTFDRKNRRVLLVRGSGDSRHIASFDPETLEHLGEIEVEIGPGRGVGALSYNAKRNIFCASQKGKWVFFLENGDSEFKFTPERDFDRSDPQRLEFISQGMGCDDSWCYLPLSPSKKQVKAGIDYNTVVVYDWDGQYHTSFTLPTIEESESMFSVDGEYYVNFNMKGAGAELFRLVVNQ